MHVFSDLHSIYIPKFYYDDSCICLHYLPMSKSINYCNLAHVHHLVHNLWSSSKDVPWFPIYCVFYQVNNESYLQYWIMGEHLIKKEIWMTCQKSWLYSYISLWTNNPYHNSYGLLVNTMDESQMIVLQQRRRWNKALAEDTQYFNLDMFKL